MTEHRRGINSGTLFWGFALIGVGVLMLLDRMDVAEFGDVISVYWPMFIVALGVAHLFERGKVGDGLWWIGVGVWFQLARLHVLGLTLATSWPFLLILFGASIIIKAIARAARRETNHGA